MKLRDVLVVLEGQVVSESFEPELEVKTACGADLMSDVLASAHCDGTLLLSGLTNPQIIRTAEMASVVAIVFVRCKMPPQETVHLAEEKRIPLISTQYTMFEACGRLYCVGLESCDVRGDKRQLVQARLSRLAGGDHSCSCGSEWSEES